MRLQRFLFFWAAACLSACAAMVETTPASLAGAAAPPGAPAVFVVQEAAVIDLPTKYTRRIESGSRWRLAGSLPEGQVFRPVDTVFTIEGRQVHEAWLVIARGSLVGFYLPGEQAYSKLRDPVPLSIGDR
jgi:hypothetical protein